MGHALRQIGHPPSTNSGHSDIGLVVLNSN
jgi:hypothetical protein